MAYQDTNTDAAPAGDESATPDLSQGYCIEISVLPDGSFKVSGPEALEDEAEEDAGEPAGSEEGEDYQSIGEALKAVLKITKENPLGADENQQFDSGYQAG